MIGEALPVRTIFCCGQVEKSNVGVLLYVTVVTHDVSPAATVVVVLPTFSTAAPPRPDIRPPLTLSESHGGSLYDPLFMRHVGQSMTPVVPLYDIGPAPEIAARVLAVVK